LAAVRKLGVLVDAFAIVAKERADVTFTFVGDGDVPFERANLEKYAAALGIKDKVTFTGQLPHVEALEHVRNAAVCVCPVMPTMALRVASPTKLVEYLAMGKPTVANDHPEHTSIAALSGNGLIICDWAPESFATGIIWCLDFPDAAQRMAERGRKWVWENRTYDKIADTVFAKLNEVIKK
jgi:glycosyltransferase involved in cell wall biosynthesis